MLNMQNFYGHLFAPKTADVSYRNNLKQLTQINTQDVDDLKSAITWNLWPGG